MVYDIEQELRDFTYITSVYKCISAYNLKGHQIGRKIGDMLEILTMGGVYSCPNLVSRLNTEGKLEGYTTAGHKVEFGFYQDPENKCELFGAIECKCVGVEETKAGKGQQSLRRLHAGESFVLRLNGDWMQKPLRQTLTLISSSANTACIKLTSSDNSNCSEIEMKIGDNIKIVVTETEELLHTTPSGNMIDEVPGIIRICKTVKLDQVSGGVCLFSLYNCLAGPQTIEKAKQASLVAMDLRKKIDGYWGKEEVNPTQKKMNFIHVICEFSHWEEKSRNVISSCIDHNVIVADAVLIKAFEVFEKRFGTQRMLDMISKNNYILLQHVKDAVQEVLDFFDCHVFYDLDLKSYVKFDYQDRKLCVTAI